MKDRQIIRITDAADPAIAPFVSIRERDLTRRHDGFIAEGTVVLRQLASRKARQNGFAARSILVLENRLPGLSEVLAGFDDDIPVYVASQQVLDAIAGFHLHRGVLAFGGFARLPTMDELLAGLGENALVLVACGIANHDNIGSIFRNAAAFGVDAVLLDETCCDPLYRKSLRVSVGSVLSVPYAYSGSTGGHLVRLQQAGFHLWGLSPAGQTDIRDLPAQPRIALVVGTEGDGLPPSILGSINSARIGQSAELDSLNVATATGIALHMVASSMGKI